MKDRLIGGIGWVLDRYHEYLMWSYFNTRHFRVWKEGGKLKWEWLTHHEYVKGVQERIAVWLDEPINTKSLTALFGLVAGCKFVIFEYQGTKKFIQFAVNGKKFIFDYPVLRTNRLRRHRYEIVGLLSLMGFIQKPPTWDYFFGKRLEYVVSENEQSWILDAWFHNNHTLAAEATYRIFKEIFHCPMDKMKVTVG